MPSLSEKYYLAVAGSPITNTTSVAKDVGIYEHVLHPNHATVSTLKKSSTPRHGLAIGASHVFAAQDDKSTVHVYSRVKGNQEATVTFSERIKSIALQDNVLILGTEEGRLILWEICTGRQITTSACHVQAVTSIAATPHHIITGSDDSNVLVWQFSRLLELDSTAEHEPIQTLSNHRAAITSLAASQGMNADTSICVSASKDKSCITWNYQKGVALRTLLFTVSPICVCLDPCARVAYVSSEDRSVFAVDVLVEKSLLVSEAIADISQVPASSALGTAPQNAGPASCLALNYDASVLLSGHPQGQVFRWNLGGNTVPSELMNVNASVTNITLVSFLPPEVQNAKPVTVMKPFFGSRTYNVTTQLSADLNPQTRFEDMLHDHAFSAASLEHAIQALQQPQIGGTGAGSDELRKENEELWGIIHEQRALQKTTMERYVEATSTKP